MDTVKLERKAAQLKIERIQLTLRQRPSTAIELADAIFVHHRYIKVYIDHLHSRGMIHVCEYRNDPRRYNRKHSPVYAWGAGADAPPPVRETNAERQRRRNADPEYRDKQAAKRRADRIKPHTDWTSAWIPRKAGE